MRECTLVAKFTVAFDEPCAHLLLLAWLQNSMGERAGRSCSAGSNSEKFAGDMGQILCFNTKSIEFYGIVETTVDALLVAAPFGLPDLSLSFSLSPASRGDSARESSFCESDKGILCRIRMPLSANYGLVGAWRVAGAEEGEREKLYES